jgi:hypothetical protein
VFSFAEAKQAYQHFEARKHIGKAVIADPEQLAPRGGGKQFGTRLAFPHRMKG